jgi:argininosuccinate lyase
MLTISRVVTDMEQWGNTEARFLDLAPQFAAVSSLMPQKKNPGAFEHMKGRAARVLGDTMTVYSCMHKTYYGDVVDLNAANIPATRVLEYATGTLKLLAGVIDTITPDKERMLEATQKGFSTVSELVDEIIISKGIPHRIAHSVVANMVNEALEKGLVATEITAELVNNVAESVLKKKLSMTEDQVKSALDPVEFVNRHDLPGGPAPKETERMVKERQRLLSDATERNKKRKEKLEQAEKKLMEATEEILK